MQSRIEKCAILVAALLLVAPLAGAATADAPVLTGSVESPVSLSASGGNLQGSLLLPAATGKVPVVLIIAGSGPTDRDGNSRVFPGPNDSLKLLANALAASGVASVRYDKRGIGASAGAMAREADLRFDTYVQDAAAWATQLAVDPRFAGVSIVGHSEGSLIGMLAARQANVTAFVSIAGPAMSAPKLLRVQLAGKLPEELVARNEQLLLAFEAGKTVDEVPAALAGLYRPSVQPYLISWFKYTPEVEIAKLKIPVGIFQGDTDIQVPASEATLLAAAKSDAELHLIAGMNHVMKTVPPDRSRQLSSYSDPTLPLSPELVRQLVDFMQRTFRADARN